MNPNHQFSPTMPYYIAPPNVAPNPQTHSRRGVPYPPPYANSPAGGAPAHQQMSGGAVRDPLGNLYYLPKYPTENQAPQLCQLCRSIFGGGGAPHPEYHPHYHPHYHPPPQVSHSVWISHLWFSNIVSLWSDWFGRSKLGVIEKQCNTVFIITGPCGWLRWFTQPKEACRTAVQVRRKTSTKVFNPDYVPPWAFSFCIDRNAVDPFVNGGMKGSNSETFLTRVAEPPPPHEDFGLANGLNDLSGVVWWLLFCYCRPKKSCHDFVSFIAAFTITKQYSRSGWLHRPHLRVLPQLGGQRGTQQPQQPSVLVRSSRPFRF